jgi:hypothetical protein
MRYDHAHMNDNIERTNENSKRPSQRRGDNNKSQRAIVSSDIKNRMEEAIMEPNIYGDPTRPNE